MRLLAWAGLFFFLPLCVPSRADSNATVAGLVTDSSGRAVEKVSIIFTNINNGVERQTETNREGIYRLPGLLPGTYRAYLTKDGFSSIVKGGIEVHVQDEISINFVLRAGSVFESITVEEGAPLLSTESSSVSTVVDRQFADNLPLNGRGFQTLIDLTPGVVLTATSPSDGGQFSIHGQRADANYFTVDGVSANTGISATDIIGNGAGGGLPVFTAQGGTNSLVSLDAMREFRIEASSASSEFGRTPGAQVSIVTRSGTNFFHGSLFDYLRNDALDANDWFAHSYGLPKPEERQNDFGGTLGGPILKGRTFFFFSYEGLRLRLPLAAISAVPDNATVAGGLNARGNAILQMRPYLNAMPLPNGEEIFAQCDPTSDPSCPASGLKPTGSAYFRSSYSDRSSLDSYSLRVDHSVLHTLNLFGRYSYSPSNLIQREPAAMSVVSPSKFANQSFTLGLTWAHSAAMSSDLRFNYGRTAAESSFALDGFGGAIPLPPFPSTDPLSHAGSELVLQTLSPTMYLLQGNDQRNVQHQINLVESVWLQKGRHSLRFGADFRRLTPLIDPNPYLQDIFFPDVSSLIAGNAFFGRVETHLQETLLFKNLGLFLQDKWQIAPRVTFNYGVRWEVDGVPKALDGPGPVAVMGFDLNDLSQLALAPSGTPPFRTTYLNFAPRIGVAYQLRQRQRFQTILRGGAGLYYDLATQEFGNSIGQSDYPYGSTKFLFDSAFPLDAASALAPEVNPSQLLDGRLSAFDPNLQLPFTVEWNFAIEQAIGQEQTVSVTYLGAAGRRLMQTALLFLDSDNFREASLVTNAASSSYHALELQWNRRLSHGLQALASYTWSHSIDDASAGSAFGNPANALVPGPMRFANRGASDFDVRHVLSAGITYAVPSANTPSWGRWLSKNWSVQSILQVRSAPPVNVYIPDLSDLTEHTQIRPDVEQGVPIYLDGSAYPGGRAINNTPSAVAGGCPDGSASVGPFCPPPLDENGLPLRQGTLGRNALRAFGATQLDLGVHRDFQVGELASLQFRAEMFNLLNHPNFGPPVNLLTFPAPQTFPEFGRATQMLGRDLAGSNLKGGGLDPLYQFGGPRSIQFALRLVF